MTGWESCVMSPQSGAVDLSGTLNDGLGPWYASVTWVTKHCVAKEFASLQDSTDRSVKDVVSSILSTQVWICIGVRNETRPNCRKNGFGVAMGT